MNTVSMVIITIEDIWKGGDIEGMNTRVVISRRQPAIFGTPASIERSRFFRLPPAMRREGVLLLLEMGQSIDQVAARLRLRTDQVRDILDTATPPFRRGGEVAD